MDRPNKAYTATVNRLLRRYGGQINDHVGIQSTKGVITVETGTTLARSVRRLMELDGARYVAVTNRETIADAVQAVNGHPIGVMDPQGNVVKMTRRKLHAADREVIDPAVAAPVSP